MHRPPSAILRDRRSEARLAIQPGNCCLDIRDDRLDLDHEEETGRWMPSQDVDGPALSVNVERHLRDGNPAARIELPEHDVDQARVITVEEAIELLALPQDANEKTGPERLEDPFARAQRPGSRAASLQARNLRGRHTGSIAELALRPVLTAPECPDGKAEPHRVHLAMVAKPR